MENMTWFLCSRKKIVGGDTGRYAGKSQQFPCACTVLSPLKEGEQTIVTSFNDVATFAHAFG